jgi:hypothetical protein
MSATVVISQTTLAHRELVPKFHEHLTLILEPERDKKSITAMGSDEVKRAADQSVGELAKLIHDIRDLLRDVSRRLSDFDNQHFKDTQGKTLELRGKWQVNVDVSLARACVRFDFTHPSISAV